MAAKLNWESASRADRVARHGSESVYRGTSTGGSTGGGELAVYAYEQAAKRAAAKTLKRGRNIAGIAQVQARANSESAAARKLKKERAKAEARRARELALELYVAQASDGTWSSVGDVEQEQTIFNIDALLRKPEFNNGSMLVVSAAHVVMTNYMDALRERFAPMIEYQDEDLFTTRLQNTPRVTILSLLCRKVRACNANDVGQLYVQMQSSLGKIGLLSKRGKRLLTRELIASRVLAITPRQRILYFSKYKSATSNE